VTLDNQSAASLVNLSEKREMEMILKLLPIAEQVVVITGASSGIGLVAAKHAAQLGARVVLSARNRVDLDNAVADIRQRGGRAIAVVADVADPQQVEWIADAAEQEFGGIDTWVNNAAVSVYGRIMDVPLDDMRRQMDVNYWGQVYGSRVAVRRLQGRGGALINVGSALSDRAIPLQGNYCAAKHALKGFTDALRMELQEQGLPIAVTLVKPASIDTPFFDKARTYLDTEPQPVPPVYAPEVVAEVIIEAAQRPIREVLAGGSGAILSAARFAPRAADLYMERYTFDAQSTGEPARRRADNLYTPVPHDGGERGRNWHGHVRGSSLYTKAVLKPKTTAAVLGACAVVAGALFRGASRTRRPSRVRPQFDARPIQALAP
jgi:NAD(P)-dependent dehydrogenase (short-subunit alcohol dehydrogenase family)